MAFVIISAWIVASDNGFQECIEKAKGGSPPGQNAYESIAALQIFLTPYRECLGEFTHTNADPILAAFTFILALSTLALWFSTRRLVKGADASAARELRAYVFERQMTLEEYGVGVRTKVSFKIGNSGKTPAYDLRHWVEVKVLPTSGPFPNLPFAPHRRVTNPRSKFAVIAIADDPLTQAEAEAVRDGKMHLFIWGRIEYRDAFRQPRWVIYRCFVQRLESAGAGQAVLAAAPDGNDAN